MRNFAAAIITRAEVTSRKSRNRFFRDYDKWTNRLFRVDSKGPAFATRPSAADAKYFSVLYLPLTLN